MGDGFFEEVERRVRDGEDIEEIIEEIAEALEDQEFREDVQDEWKSYFRKLRNDPGRIYDIEDRVDILLDRGFQELGSSSEEFSEYISNAIENSEHNVEELERGIFSWHSVLACISVLEEEPLPEYKTPIAKLFRQISEENPQELEEILDEPIQWRKFLYGFKKSMSRTRKNGKPKDQQLVDKIEIVEELFESIYRPTMIFVGKLVSIRIGYSTNVDNSDVRQRIEASNLDISKFWDGEAKHIRNSSAHNTYRLFDGRVIMADRDWKGNFSEEELDDKISKLAEVSRHTLYALSEVYAEYLMEC